MALTTDEALDRGLRLLMREVRPRTYDNHQYNVKIFREWMAKYHRSTLRGPIDAVDRLLLEDYLSYLAHDRVRWEGHRRGDGKDNKGLSQNTINNHIDTLRAIFRRLEEDEYIERNPTKNIKPTKVESSVQPLSPEEFQSMMQQPNTETFLGMRDYFLMNLLLETAMLVSEVLTMTLDRVDEDGAAFFIPPQLAKNKQGRWVHGSHELRRIYRRYIVARKQWFDLRPHLTDEGWLIVSSRSGGQVWPTAIQQRFRKYQEAARIDPSKRCSPHVWRHTSAVQELLNGRDAESLRRKLGHKTMDMTARYIALTNDDMQELQEKYSVLDNMRRANKRRKLGMA